MNDNFDINVARRKPNVVKRTRPVHPWDVNLSPPEEESPEQFIVNNDADSFSDKKSLIDNEAQPPSNNDFAAISRTENITVNVNENTEDKPLISFDNSIVTDNDSPAFHNKTISPILNKIAAQKPLSSLVQGIETKHKKHVSSLSDSINIHSNYCKLDNDISDHLFQRLSPSAQSVYLRLYRQSYGWNRNWAAESLPKLTKSCNLSLQTVRKALKELETIGAIRKEFSDYHKATVYRVCLPSEIGITGSASHNNTLAVNRGLNITSHGSDSQLSESQTLIPQNSNTDSFDIGDTDNLEVKNISFRGQDSVIQSIFFSGASIYSIIESAGTFPKNNLKYMTDIHVREAVSIVDEFYDSIGFSIVSRSQYIKSLSDYFELVKSGFSPDDVRYAVRWTFKNLRTRPESFSLIKHTIHLAMEDLIKDLKNVSVQKEYEEKMNQAAAQKLEWERLSTAHTVKDEDIVLFESVKKEMKNTINEFSFSSFIEPLKLLNAFNNEVTLGSPPDSVSWVRDHYTERIMDIYREFSGREIKVEIR